MRELQVRRLWPSLRERLGIEPAATVAQAPKVASPASSISAERIEAIWSHTRPGAGSPVGAYLRSRGITIPVPDTMRYALLEHREAGQHLPCMVARVDRCGEPGPVALHRTFLRSGGQGKADVEPAKKMLGPVGGGVVRLAEPGHQLALAEGIETALSFMELTGIPTWAALSAGNLSRVILPDLPLAAEVIIAADRGTPGMTAAREAAARYSAEGRTVRVLLPRRGENDFNDELAGRWTR